MSTTAVFAELVINGLLVIIWLGLLVLSIIGPPATVPTADNLAVEVGLLLAFAYALGVVFDRVWDLLLDQSGIHQALRRWASKPLEANDMLRRKIYGRDPSVAAEFVNYNRSRMRVARASVFNFVLITITGAVFIGLHREGFGSKHFLTALAVGSLLSILAGVAFVKLSKTYERSLRVVGGDDLAP